jgi:hypothetical protein
VHLTLWGGVAALRGRAQACAAALALLATPFFAVQGATQTGDVPLAYYILASLVALRFGARGAAAAGALAALSAFTKNEGLLFAAVLAGALCVPGLRRSLGAGVPARLLAGAAPGLAAVAAFKLFLSSPNDILKNSQPGALAKMVVDPWRYGAIAKAVGEQLLRFRGGDVAGAGNGPAWMAGYALAMGAAPGQRRFGFETVVAAALVATYVAIFVVTPYDLHWHLMTALARLLLHVWPAALLAVFLAVNAPARRA